MEDAIRKAEEIIARSYLTGNSEAIIGEQAYQMSKILFGQDMTREVTPVHFNVIHTPNINYNEVLGEQETERMDVEENLVQLEERLDVGNNKRVAEKNQEAPADREVGGPPARKIRRRHKK